MKSLKEWLILWGKVNGCQRCMFNSFTSILEVGAPENNANKKPKLPPLPWARHRCSPKCWAAALLRVVTGCPSFVQDSRNVYHSPKRGGAVWSGHRVRSLLGDLEDSYRGLVCVCWGPTRITFFESLKLNQRVLLEKKHMFDGQQIYKYIDMVLN